MKLSFSLNNILELLENPETQGSFNGEIRKIASLDEAQDGHISFLGNKKYKKQVATSNASIIIIPETYKGSEPKDNQAYIKVKDPSAALSKICRDIEVKFWPKYAPGIHPSAVIDATANIAKTAHIGPFCYIGANVTIGEHTVLESHVNIAAGAVVGENCRLKSHVSVSEFCVLGDRVCLQYGVVIGGDGFGYAKVDGVHIKEPQIGNVVLGDDVEIGSNTTIDRARFGETSIGNGTKLDNLIMVGHNVKIGAHCILTGQIGIAGSTTLGDNVIVGGQTGFNGHINVASGCMIGAQSMVHKDLEPNSFVMGAPVYPINLAYRLELLRKRLPELFKRVDDIESKLNFEATASTES